MLDHYTVYTDVTGRVLKVGQKVVYCVVGKHLKVATVTKLYPETVELDVETTGSKPMRRKHSLVAIVSEVTDA